jgi:hypothetical protein
MYPKTFLDNFWRGDLRREVFVIMPFDSSLERIWKEAIRPAIEELKGEDGGGYQPRCVRENIPAADIVREIVDGITNSTLVFADISLLPGEPLNAQRNGNVMYELGIANAYREESDMIVVKSDQRRAEFDIATNRYHQYDHNNISEAKSRFLELLESALRLRKGIKKSICESTWASLDVDCFNFMVQRPREQPFLHKNFDEKEFAALRRLLSLGIINVEYVTPSNGRHLTWYKYTPFGIAVVDNGRFASDQDVEKFSRPVFGLQLESARKKRESGLI